MCASGQPGKQQSRAYQEKPPTTQENMGRTRERAVSCLRSWIHAVNPSSLILLPACLFTHWLGQLLCPVANTSASHYH